MCIPQQGHDRRGIKAAEPAAGFGATLLEEPIGAEGVSMASIAPVGLILKVGPT